MLALGSCLLAKAKSCEDGEAMVSTREPMAMACRELCKLPVSPAGYGKLKPPVWQPPNPASVSRAACYVIFCSSIAFHPTSRPPGLQMTLRSVGQCFPPGIPTFSSSSQVSSPPPQLFPFPLDGEMPGEENQHLCYPT